MADSQLLFYRSKGCLFLDSVRARLGSAASGAAYVGASNGDNPAFFEVFKSAMESVGIAKHRMILSSFVPEDRLFLESADLILLAGGDVERGWKVMKQTGMKEVILARYCAGALLIGISAGAVQLGLSGVTAGGAGFDTFGLVPLIIGAHEEETDWRALKRAAAAEERHVSAIGIPAGGGLIYHPQRTVEAIRHPLHEFSKGKDRLTHHLLRPENA